MLSLFKIWTSFQSYVNTFQGSWYRPISDFQPAVNDISMQLWENWTALLEKSQEIQDRLSPFKMSKNLVVNGATARYGELKFPKDYDRFSSARIIRHNDTCVPCPDVDGGACDGFKTQEEVTDKYFDGLKESRVELVDNQRWAACLDHLTKKPTLEAPKMVQTKSGWNVAPRKVSVIVLDWYKRPKEGTFRYTITPGNPQTGAGDFLVYDDALSEKLEWEESIINEFIWRLGERFGLFTYNQFTAQISTQLKQMK